MAEPHRILKEALRLRLRGISAAWSMAEVVIELSVDVMTETDLRVNDPYGIGMMPIYAEMHRHGDFSPGSQ